MLIVLSSELLHFPVYRARRGHNLSQIFTGIRLQGQRQQRHRVSPLGEHLVDWIAVHQSGQHTKAHAVGRPVRTAISTTRIPSATGANDTWKRCSTTFLRANPGVETATPHRLEWIDSVGHQANTLYHNSFQLKEDGPATTRQFTAAAS
jgi:hypothetical protein